HSTADPSTATPAIYTLSLHDALPICNVALDKSWGAPTVTKDGVSVAKEIELDEKVANLGVQMVKEVASRTNDDTGDGTTTATVQDRKSTRLNSSHVKISYAVFCLKKK